MLRELARSDKDIEYSREARALPHAHGLRIKLMAVADVIVTKPGGLITSEALACGLMITIVDPYAGQEERNASMLLEEGAAIQVHDYNLLAFRLDPILKHSETLDRYKANAARVAKPDAARQIVNCIMSGNLSEA